MHFLSGRAISIVTTPAWLALLMYTGWSADILAADPLAETREQLVRDRAGAFGDSGRRQLRPPQHRLVPEGDLGTVGDVDADGIHGYTAYQLDALSLDPHGRTVAGQPRVAVGIADSHGCDPAGALAGPKTVITHALPYSDLTHGDHVRAQRHGRSQRQGRPAAEGIFPIQHDAGANPVGAQGRLGDQHRRIGGADLEIGMQLVRVEKTLDLPRHDSRAHVMCAAEVGHVYQLRYAAIRR